MGELLTCQAFTCEKVTFWSEICLITTPSLPKYFGMSANP